MPKLNHFKMCFFRKQLFVFLLKHPDSPITRFIRERQMRDYKVEPYSAAGYLTDKLTERSVVITKAQGLELLRKRGYISKDDLAAEKGCSFPAPVF